MKKSIVKKLILVVILTAFFSQVYPSIVRAAKIEWENPNKNGTNPYKFRLKDSFNSALIMQVVGCTGVVNKVSQAITDFPRKISDEIAKKAKERAARKACERSKDAIAKGVAFIGKEFVAAIAADVRLCNSITDTEDASNVKATEKQTATINAAETADKCLNGVAKTLARNQLTAMTKYTLNWVTSGFEGDPMYVRNIESFMGRITEDIVQKEMEWFKGQPEYYPYANDYYRGKILGDISIKNYKNSMKQNLSNYLGSGGLGEDGATVVEKYTNNFGSGGWNGWLAFTQYPQNNYLGYTLKTTEYIANKQNSQIADINAQLDRNGGILDQKKCVAKGLSASSANKNKIEQERQANVAKAYQTAQIDLNKYNECQSKLDALNRDPTAEEVTMCEELQLKSIESTNDYNSMENNNVTDQGEENMDCTKWETVTPGSLIRDKVSEVLNTDINQLELAKDINDSLNAVFTVLLSKLQNQGLTSLSSGGDGFTDATIDGYNSATYDEVDEDGNIVRSGGAGFSGSIDLTKELGNTYTHATRQYLGKWNAETNTPRLYPNSGITKSYYEVSVAGNTKLINNGYNGWEVGDRAYFDGKEWQNWKKGSDNPIEKRGIIQIQKDYVVGATEILKVLPTVMPKLGELDYCIPGPNQNWEANSEEASSEFLTLVNTLSPTYNSNGSQRNQDSQYYLAGPGDTEYENYQNIFDGADKMWAGITTGKVWNGNTVTEYDWYIPNAWKSIHNWINKEWKSDESKEIVRGQVENTLDRINSNTNQFFVEYKKSIDRLYGVGSPLQNQYKMNESTGFERDARGNKIENAGYLPMAQAGLEITKDMLVYNETIEAAKKDYRDGIAEANANVAKLDIIKKEVNAIVKKAQDRRKANLIKIINEESIKSGRKNEKGETYVLSEADYYKEYASCLEEEQVIYYDENQIISDPEENGAVRCKDQMDNDLNGLTDSEDPNCAGFGYIPPEKRIPSDRSPSGATTSGAPRRGKIEPITLVSSSTRGTSAGNQTSTNTNTGYCIIGDNDPSVNQDSSMPATNGVLCSSRATANECQNGGLYYHLGTASDYSLQGKLFANKCKWETQVPSERTKYGCEIQNTGNKVYSDFNAQRNLKCFERTASSCTSMPYIDVYQNIYTCNLK